jgi:hypothetical protein
MSKLVWAPILAAVRQPALVVCLLGLVTALSSAPAGAQASRTWVSGAGLDTNPCSRTQPCLTFAAAFAVTATGGEINVLDPGGFGSVTINRAVSIYNDGAGEAGIVVSSTNAIIINAGTADVNLRGLTLNGQGGGLGVHILAAGRVSIQNRVIQQFGTGVNVATSANLKLKIQDTTIINNTNGVSVQPGGGAANVSIERSRVDLNTGQGVTISGAFGGSPFLAMSDSSASLNSGIGILVVSQGGTVIAAALDNVRASSNNYGVAVSNGGRAMIKRSLFSGNFTAGVEGDPGAIIAIKDTLISNNATGILSSSGASVVTTNSDINSNNIAISGVVRSTGDNNILFNVSDGTPLTPVGSPSSENGLR